MDNIYQMGFIIKEKRRQLGLTQKELAEKLGVSDKAVSKWERCESLPDVTLIPLIAVTLGVSIDCLMTGKEHASAENGAAQTEETQDEVRQARELSVQMYMQKAETKYLAAAVAIQAVTLCGIFVLFNLNSVFYGFGVMAVYIVFTAYMRPYNRIVAETGGRDFGTACNGILGISVFGGLLIIIAVKLVQSHIWSVKYDAISWVFVGIGVNIPINFIIGVFILLAVFNMWCASGGKYYRKNIVLSAVGASVISIAAISAVLIKAGLIQQNNIYLFTDYVKLNETKQWITKLESVNILVWVVTAAAVAVIVIFVKNKAEAFTAAAVVAAMGVYLAVCLANGVDYGGQVTDYTSNARIDTYGVYMSIYLAAVVPQICLALNMAVDKIKSCRE